MPPFRFVGGPADGQELQALKDNTTNVRLGVPPQDVNGMIVIGHIYKVDRENGTLNFVGHQTITKAEAERRNMEIKTR